VRDAAGHVLSYRVTNIFPQASDPQNKGIAYGELIFHHDFARGEQRASFTDEKSEVRLIEFPGSPVPPLLLRPDKARAVAVVRHGAGAVRSDIPSLRIDAQEAVGGQ